MIMKKEQMELKELIKEAILEAFAEMYGVATLGESAPEEEDGEGGKKKDPIRPDPMYGIGGFSLR